MGVLMLARSNIRPVKFILAVAATLSGGCFQSVQNQAISTGAHLHTAATQDVNSSTWIGVYTSPSEVGGFSGTVLSVEAEFQTDRLRYRMTFYSDVVLADAIDEKEKSGQLLPENNELFVPEASGYTSDGKVSLLAKITRYTRIQINGHTVLMRDDALKEYREHDRLYDYGILIKVQDSADFFVNLDKVKHESLKVLYKDPGKEWKDPFVHGANDR
jgi:hypothetical protein